MDQGFWLTRWRDGQVGWHRDAVHEDLVAHSDWLLQGAERVCVPLCGKSLDLDWLAARVEVVGLELSPIACAAVVERLGGPSEGRALGPMQVHEVGRLTLLCGDFFAATAAAIGPIDRVWDRAAYIALPPSVRPRYAAHLRALLGDRGRVLVVRLEYNDCDKTGPPYSVSAEELAAAYAGAQITSLPPVDASGEIRELWRDQGMTSLSLQVHQITLPGGGS